MSSPGGVLSPWLLSRFLIRDRSGEALGNSALGLIAVLGVVMLWSALVAIELGK